MTPTNVYIDGFNLYYGCIRRTPFKWLNLAKLCSQLLPSGYQIHRIRYFTARVSGTPNNPDAPTRQQIYLRALRTLPNVSISYGRFLTTKTMMPLADPPPSGPKFVRVIKTEEKGSDVNFASHLLLDAFRNDASAAFVVSNDSDLLEPIRIVRQQFALKVGLACPHQRPSLVLVPEVDFLRTIREGVLRASQFATTLTDAKGTFSKPSTW